MKSMEYKAWCDWHLNGKPEMNWSKEIEQEMVANEFAMNLLVPKEAVKRIAKEQGGLEKMISSIKSIANYGEMFGVPCEVFYFQVLDMIEEEDKNNLELEPRKENIVEKIIKKVLRHF